MIFLNCRIASATPHIYPDETHYRSLQHDSLAPQPRLLNSSQPYFFASFAFNKLCIPDYHPLLLLSPSQAHPYTANSAPSPPLRTLKQAALQSICEVSRPFPNCSSQRGRFREFLSFSLFHMEITTLFKNDVCLFSSISH